VLINYENDTIGNLEDMQEDGEIRPSNSINQILGKLPEVLGSNEPNFVFKFVCLIELLESITVTSNIFQEDTIKELEAISEQEATNESELYRRANKKLKIILKKVFANTKSDSPLKA